MWERIVMSLIWYSSLSICSSMPKSSGIGKWNYKEWKLTELKEIMSRWQTVLHDRGWNANYMGNHDQPRPVSRFGDDGKYRVRSAQMLATSDAYT